jgi:hypothetical protein
MKIGPIAGTFIQPGQHHHSVNWQCNHTKRIGVPSSQPTTVASMKSKRFLISFVVILLNVNNVLVGFKIVTIFYV